MNSAVGPARTESAHELCARRLTTSPSVIRASAIAVLLLGATAPAWTQNPPDKPAAPAASEAAPTPATTQKPHKAAPGGSDAKAPNEKAQASYSLGVSMGDQLHHLGLTNDSIVTERVTQGLRDALSGKVTMSNEHRQSVENLIRTARTSLAESNHAVAAAFLAENGKKKDVVTTSSGLEYHIVKPGEGDSPKPTDQVTVHYRGTLLDGTEFDSSYKRGQPATFPVNGVIPGWQEALVLMKPGSKWELFVPPKLAYDLNSPPSIPPGSLLKFDVELLSIKQAAPVLSAPKPPSQQ